MYRIRNYLFDSICAQVFSSVVPFLCRHNGLSVNEETMQNEQALFAEMACEVTINGH